MLNRSFHLEIRTPEQLIYEGNVTNISAPGVEGNFQILAGHIPFLTALEVGEIRIRESETPQLMATSGGVFEVLRTGVTVLVERSGHRKSMWNVLKRHSTVLKHNSQQMRRI